MTVTKIALLFAALALLCIPCAFAQDSNAMTPEQLQAYIAQLQRSAQPQNTVITIQTSEQLQSDLSMLKENMAALVTANTKMEERFGRLADDIDARMQASEKSQTADLAAQMAKMFSLQETAFLDALRAYTSPLRQSLPQIGVFAMLAGAFLLWASRQYRLTEGIRKKPESKKGGRANGG